MRTIETIDPIASLIRLQAFLLPFRSGITPKLPSMNVHGLPQMMTLEQVAHVLNVSERTVHRIKKEIKFTRVRGSLRFDPQHVRAYLEERMVTA